MQNDATQTPPRRPLRTVAIILYATLALLWLAIPQSVSNFTRESLPGWARDIAVPVAEAVETGSRALGIPAAYESLRETFLRSFDKK
ncbi:MAG: hypothetical protein KF794_04280 [Xanthobacteraceae bacterium]|nr:hypothetical protein [Xanthobacteraceae bacterium]QYK45920.1 MAG: hypothetical protein KF794_04280 [Xanthobacteraceae bacterium]HMN52476.1 hypothetical protein [Xanthobacteraceae bacterium]